MRRLVLFFVLFLLVSVAPVFAQNSKQQICFTTLAPIAEGEAISRVLDESCFNNLAEAAAYFSDGAVQLSPSASIEEYETAMAAQQLYTIVRFYDWTNFVNLLVVYQSSYTCATSSFGTYIPAQYQDYLESADTVWCKYLTVYDTIWQSGNQFSCSPDGYYPHCPTFYSLNNKVKSWRSWGQ